jgi:ABC-type amino acid transport system permease subunit
MTANLLIGLPGDRPGGLLLTILIFFASGLAALVLGFIYATTAAANPRASLPLQAGSAVLRGVPLLLLIFMLAHVPGLSMHVAGFLALVLYSFSHVGEVIRSFIAAYPRSQREQARLMGLRAASEWFQLRAPWTLWRSWNALFTHWVSLLKDTGALVLLGIGELTTVAKILSEQQASFERWIAVLLLAGALYLGATMVLIRVLQRVPGRLRRLAVAEEGQKFSGLEKRSR